MGYGDAILASGRARGLHAQGKLAAFSVDGKTIKWTGFCENVFKHNPNIARPGMENLPNIVWLPHYKRNSPYCKYENEKFIWNYDFKVTPGELFFEPLERERSAPRPVDRFIVIEPNVSQRFFSRNKDWGDGKYELLAKALMGAGHLVVQCIHDNSQRELAGVHRIHTPTFRHAVNVMSQASLIITPEGANHHVAAAVNVPAIVLWGGWSPAQTMGYDNHINLTGGAPYACGSTALCPHCREAFDNISVEQVYQEAQKWMMTP